MAEHEVMLFGVWRTVQITSRGCGKCSDNGALIAGIAGSRPGTDSRQSGSVTFQPDWFTCCWNDAASPSHPQTLTRCDCKWVSFRSVTFHFWLSVCRGVGSVALLLAHLPLMIVFRPCKAWVSESVLKGKQSVFLRHLCLHQIMANLSGAWFTSTTLPLVIFSDKWPGG